MLDLEVQTVGVCSLNFLGFVVVLWGLPGSEKFVCLVQIIPRVSIVAPFLADQFYG